MSELTMSQIRKLIQLTHSEKMRRKHEDSIRNAGVIGELDEILIKLDKLQAKNQEG